MAKTNITEYSATPSSNTDINNINIDENCPASGLNNAIRELMAHLKNVDTGSQALTALSVTGNATVNDGITVTDSGASPIIANRTTSDGTIVDLQKDGSTVGTIGSISGAYLYMDSPTASFFRINGTNEVAIASAKMYSPTDGRTDLGSSSERFKDLYLSGGAYIGGTGSANKLDDYEEGTFTAQLSTDTTYFGDGAQLGVYTKIGNICFFEIKYQRTGTVNTGVNARFGLPFTSANNSVQATGSRGSVENIDTAMVGIGGTVASNSAILYLNEMNTATTGFNVDGNDLGTNFQIQIQGFYKTA